MAALRLKANPVYTYGSLHSRVLKIVHVLNLKAFFQAFDTDVITQNVMDVSALKHNYLNQFPSAGNKQITLYRLTLDSLNLDTKVKPYFAKNARNIQRVSSGAPMCAKKLCTLPIEIGKPIKPEKNTEWQRQRTYAQIRPGDEFAFVLDLESLLRKK